MKMMLWLRRHGAGIAGQLFQALPLALMFLLALTPGISFTEDLGRHLLLGKIIATSGQVPTTNLLTYTCPDFPFINHHWLSEVVFYFAHRAVGLNGLIVLKALLMCAALALAGRAVPLKQASPLVVFAATLAAIALGYRAHIRPELFTYLGIAFYGWFLARAARAKLSGWSWAILIVYGFFWANAHIYFIFGLGMIFCYWLACWWRNWRDGNPLLRAYPRAETIGLISLIAISLLNPHGWRGLVYPLGIFGNYGMAITENAAPLDYWQTVLNPMLLALPFLSMLALLVFWRTLIGRLGHPDGYRGRPAPFTAGQIASVFILLTALIAAWLMARSAPLLALTILPALGFCVERRRNELTLEKHSNPPPDQICLHPHFIKCDNIFFGGSLRSVAILLVSLLNLWLTFSVLEGSYSRVFPSPIGPTPFGLDDESRYLELRRLRKDGLPGKIFSDYNSGSLVEYNIYPELGYVDNRPEAFPATFWQEEYLPALSLSTVWEEVVARRGIQTVAVSLAGVKEHFIRALLSDPRWQLVHLDFFFAVFTRNTPQNQDFLRRHVFQPEHSAQLAGQIAERIGALSRTSLWRRQVLADQIIYELYALICLGESDLAWPLVLAMHLRYTDYQLIHELMRVSAPPEAGQAVMEVMARRARWPLAVKQVLDYGAALEAQGRGNEARAVYRRGKFFFPLSPSLPPPGR